MTRRSVVTCFVILVGLVVAADAAGQKQKQGAKGAPAVEYSSASDTGTAPFSEYVRVGNTLYLAGRLGTDSTGKLAAGGIAAETKQALENIKVTLEKHGSSMDNVVKCTVMLADINERAQMNAVYTTFFKKDHMPARSAFGTTGLALGARVEIECIATLK